MHMRPISHLSYKEKRQKLISEITKKSSGALSKAEVTSIVKQLNITLPYQLELVHSYDEMCKRIVLKQFSPDNSTDFYTKEYGSILLGSASFGFLDNQGLTASPILNPNQKLVLLKSKHAFRCYKGFNDNLWKKHTIIMYIPYV